MHKAVVRALILILVLAVSGCAAGTGEPAETISVPPRPQSSQKALKAAEAAGLDEECELAELRYRVSSAWTMREEDDTQTGDMIARIYTVQGDTTAALDVLRKGISLIERDALEEGKRNLGSVGQFTKQWESTYGISLTQELAPEELPDGADHGWVFESLGEGRGGQGLLLVADMYMYAVYYAAEDSAENPFRPVWDAVVGSVSIERPAEQQGSDS